MDWARIVSAARVRNKCSRYPLQSEIKNLEVVTPHLPNDSVCRLSSMKMAHAVINSGR